MKTRYLLIFAMFTYQSLQSQNVVSTLKNFYNNAPFDCYIDKIKKNILDEYNLSSQGLTLFRKPPVNEINLRSDNTVFMLTIQFVKTESFNYNDDIYNYISIDSSRVFTIACVDKMMNVHAFANYFEGLYTYYDVKRDHPNRNYLSIKKLSQVIKNIKKHDPELILYCHTLLSSRGLVGRWDDNGFMYIKDNKIYVYNVPDGKIFELNDFVHKFYSLERVHNLNVEFIPILHQDCKNTRRTGHTPENEKMMCQ